MDLIFPDGTIVDDHVTGVLYKVFLDTSRNDVGQLMGLPLSGRDSRKAVPSADDNPDNADANMIEVGGNGMIRQRGRSQCGSLALVGGAFLAAILLLYVIARSRAAGR